MQSIESSVFIIIAQITSKTILMLSSLKGTNFLLFVLRNYKDALKILRKSDIIKISEMRCANALYGW